MLMNADIVKTDGKYIYYVVGKKIIIADISKKDELSQISEIDFSNRKIYSIRIIYK